MLLDSMVIHHTLLTQCSTVITWAPALPAGRQDASRAEGYQYEWGAVGQAEGSHGCLDGQAAVLAKYISPISSLSDYICQCYNA